MNAVAARALGTNVGQLETHSDGAFGQNITGVFDTRADAQEAIDQMLVNYHPAGYGTHFHPIFEVDGLFAVRGHRYNSCD